VAEGRLVDLQDYAAIFEMRRKEGSAKRAEVRRINRISQIDGVQSGNLKEKTPRVRAAENPFGGVEKTEGGEKKSAAAPHGLLGTGNRKTIACCTRLPRWTFGQ